MIQESRNLKIEAEFQFLIPPLSEEEYSQLERNIVEHGCLDPIKVWAGHDIILDGHNRYTICIEQKIDYKIHQIDLETKEDAINWSIKNQLGRRNLTETQKSYLRGKKYNNEKKVAHRPEKGDQSDHVKTSEKMAKEENKGSATIRRYAKFAAAVDKLSEDAGHEFGKKLFSGEIKLPRSDILKLAKKPVDEKKALVDEIQKGAKGLSQAEIALRMKNKPQQDVFDEADSEIEFAGWSWDPKKLDAPKNTIAPQKDNEIKHRLVYIRDDIFGDGFTKEETDNIIQVMRESPQWVFMVHTEIFERLDEVDWPTNAWIGCIVESQENAEDASEAFKEITADNKFVICDIHKESIAFDDLSGFNWIIIRNPSKVQPPWLRLESVLEQALADSLWIYQMPNVRIRPREYPRFQAQEAESKAREVTIQEPVQGVA